VNNIVKFCEFIGDSMHDFDEVGFKKYCEHIGFAPREGQLVCTKHSQPIQKNVEGWRLCCAECVAPVHVKMVDVETDKTFSPRGDFQQFRMESPVAFDCPHCKKMKKSKLVAVKDGNWEELFCNGCYGQLLAKEGVL